MPSDWYVYALECADETLYTGITTDVERRVREHNGERTGGANYTRARRPVRVRAAWPCDDQSEAASAEAAFKSLSRDEKLGRIAVGLSPSRFEDVVDEYLAVFDVDGAEPTQFQPVSLAGDDGTDVALATRMREHVEDAREALAERAPGPTRPATEPVFFLGPGFFDGHALALEGGPAVFFDLRLLGHHFDDEGFAPAVHAAHEWAHAVHYANAPTFYPGRDKPPTEQIWHRLVAEGLAIRCSEEVTGCGPRLSCWFGFMDEGEFDAWRDRADERRADLGAAIADVDASVRFDGDLWDELLRAMETPVESRLGYWYGRQLVERAEQDSDLGDLLVMPPSQWQPLVRRYFTDTDSPT